LPVRVAGTVVSMLLAAAISAVVCIGAVWVQGPFGFFRSSAARVLGRLQQRVRVGGFPIVCVGGRGVGVDQEAGGSGFAMRLSSRVQQWRGMMVSIEMTLNHVT